MRSVRGHSAQAPHRAMASSACPAVGVAAWPLAGQGHSEAKVQDMRGQMCTSNACGEVLVGRAQGIRSARGRGWTHGGVPLPRGGNPATGLACSANKRFSGHGGVHIVLALIRAALQCRCGLMRLRCGRAVVALFNLYLPVVAGHAPQAQKLTQDIVEWMRLQLLRLLVRTRVVIAGDLNAHFGDEGRHASGDEVAGGTGPC